MGTATAEMAEANAAVRAEAEVDAADEAPDEASGDANIKSICTVDWKCYRKKIVNARPVVTLPG